MIRGSKIASLTRRLPNPSFGALDAATYDGRVISLLRSQLPGLLNESNSRRLAARFDCEAENLRTGDRRSWQCIRSMSIIRHPMSPEVSPTADLPCMRTWVVTKRSQFTHSLLGAEGAEGSTARHFGYGTIIAGKAMRLRPS